MAKLHGERIKPESHGTAEHGDSSGLMDDIKAHKVEVIIGGITLLVSLYIITRPKSATAPVTTATGTGSLLSGSTPASTTPASNTVTTDMLASALATINGQEATNLQTIQQQLASFGQTIASLGSGSPTSSGASGIPGFPTGANLPGSGFGSVVQGNGNAITNALQARNKLGDTTIVNFFKNLSLPSWIGLQYVAENFALPWTPGSTPTAAQTSALNTWLDTHGYRNASTQTFTSVVSSSTVPANVQAQLTAAYGG